MDELTRERFWPLPTPPPNGLRRIPDEFRAPWQRESDEVIAERQRILLGIDAEAEERQATADTVRTARLRAYALRRDRKLAAAIRRAV